MSAPPARFAGGLHAHFDALPAAWRDLLADTLRAPALQRLVAFVDGRAAAGRVIFPPRPLAALEQAAPDQVRVVILGQDPYHGAGQAHGYAFSVLPGVAPPPSLRNIFLELARDCGCPAPTSGSLVGWSRQGVLLLNAVLTVEEGQAASHARHGWETFTDAVIGALARRPEPKVFLLWGGHAQSKRGLIEAAGRDHAVLVANHPSPLSARRPPQPFLGCAHFSQANAFLQARGRGIVDWCRTGDASPSPAMQAVPSLARASGRGTGRG